MVNWTDKIIHWNQLPGSDVRRLLDTWGMTPEQIARYDRKHGIVSAQPKTPEVATPEVKPAAKKAPAKKAPAKKAPAKKAPAKKAAAKKAPAKKVASVTRQRHHGKDGEVRFLEHRNLWIGFAGGKVVVTKRTAQACREVLAAQFGITLQD